MIRTRLRKILRDVWSRKARTALVSISIFIGVFGTVTLFTMGDLLVKQLEEDLDKDELAMLRIFVQVKDGAEVNNDTTLAALRSQPGVTGVEGQAVYPLFWKKAGANEFETSRLFAYSEPFELIQLEPMRLIEGHYPQSEANRKEIVVERRFADEYEVEIGDELTLRILSKITPETSTLPEENWTVVGIVFFPYSYGGGFNPVLPEDSLFANYTDAQYITGFSGFSSIYSRFTDYETAKAQQVAFKEAVESETPYVPQFDQIEDPEKNSLITFSTTTRNTLASLAILALTVAGFLVFNVVNAIVVEQRRQIGTMKSLGATRPDNFLIYTGMAFVYGLIGVVPGVILGIPMGFFAAQGLATQANSLIDDFAVSPNAIVLGIVLGLLVPVVASLLPVFNGTRVRIVEAMTDLGIEATYGTGPIARLLARLGLPSNMKQGISNVLKHKWRSGLTIVTLSLAAGAFMGVFAVFASINNVLNDFFDTFQYSFNVVADNTEAAELETLVLNNTPNAVSGGPFVSSTIQIDGYDKEYDPATGPPALFANGYDPTSGAYDLELDSGVSLSENPNGVILSKSITDEIGKKAGDVITIRAGGNSGAFEIVGIATYPFDGVWFDWQVLARLLGFVDENDNPIARGVIVRMNEEDPTAQNVDDRIEHLNEKLLSNGVTASYNNIELFKESISQTVSVFSLIFNFTALLIALVGAVGLLTTLSMSVFERQKEIGVMRSIGARSSTIVGQFLTEGVFVGLLAWLIGLPISYVLSNALITGLNLGDEYQLTFPAIAIVIGLVGTLTITTLASIWPSIAAARKTVSDILRYQ